MKDKTISMEAVVKIIRFECGEFHGISGRIIEKLEALPSAQPEYERVSAEDVAVSIAPTKLASAVWLYGTLTELEKAGYVICRRMT